MVSVALAPCGLAQLEGRRSQAYRCSRARRPSGSDSGVRDRPGVPPRRYRHEIGDPWTRTPPQRACRPQRSSSPLIAQWSPTSIPSHAKVPPPAAHQPGHVDGDRARLSPASRLSPVLAATLGRAQCSRPSQYHALAMPVEGCSLRASGWRPCSRVRAAVLSPVAGLVRRRLAAGFAVRSLAARFVLAGLAAGLAVRCLAARLVHGCAAVRLAL